MGLGSDARGGASCSDFQRYCQKRVFSHFSTLLYEVHLLREKHHFLWRIVRGLGHEGLQGNNHSFANWRRVSHKVEGLIQDLKETMQSVQQSQHLKNPKQCALKTELTKQPFKFYCTLIGFIFKLPSGTPVRVYWFVYHHDSSPIRFLSYE